MRGLVGDKLFSTLSHRWKITSLSLLDYYFHSRHSNNFHSLILPIGTFMATTSNGTCNNQLFKIFIFRYTSFLKCSNLNLFWNQKCSKCENRECSCASLSQYLKWKIFCVYNVPILNLFCQEVLLFHFAFWDYLFLCVKTTSCSLFNQMNISSKNLLKVFYQNKNFNAFSSIKRSLKIQI